MLRISLSFKAKYADSKIEGLLSRVILKRDSVSGYIIVNHVVNPESVMAATTTLCDEKHVHVNIRFLSLYGA